MRKSSLSSCLHCHSAKYVIKVSRHPVEDLAECVSSYMLHHSSGIAFCHCNLILLILSQSDSMDMNLGKLQEIVEDRDAWHAAVHEDAKNWTPL